MNDTVNVMHGSAIVTGNGSQWLSSVKSGDMLAIDGASQWYDIKSVESNRLITLDEPFSGETESKVAYYILSAVEDDEA